MEIKMSEESRIKSRKSFDFFLLVIGYLLLTSCSFRKQIPPPPNLISMDTMEFILVDMTLNEAILNNGGVPNDTVKSFNVLQKYHISPAQFDSSFAYYSKNPQKLKEIYANVLEDLNQK